MSDMRIVNNSDYWVGILSSYHHPPTVLRKVKGLESLKQGDYFDVSFDEYGCDGMGRIYQATTNYYLDDPEDELGCVDANEIYNPEI